MFGFESRTFNRTTPAAMRQGFVSLGIPEGSVICIHSSLRGLGHIVGGPRAVILALQEAVPGCTIIMPTFPFSGTMLEHIRSQPGPFDPTHTPSKSGLLSETLRNMPGTIRGIHPTHSCAAIGPRAQELLEGSENCPTPFGPDSAYGRFAWDKDAYLLLINTNNASIVHCIQEKVAMPNLFLDEPALVDGLDEKGRLRTYQVSVHQPRVPLYVAMAGKNNKGLQFIWFPDYCLLFPEKHGKDVLEEIENPESRDVLLNRHDDFLAQKIYRQARIKGCEIMAVHVQPWIERIAGDVASSIAKVLCVVRHDHPQSLP
ncbi:AAC(3) family N-acetyltransferase [Desulfonatronum thioautotrophicum]|uniref:AAC(3) family N-acetyltransferase n=1 Tax=Desulfonatronum thioautotrophicum TaxID=617001 RepID=UPI00069AD01E|nr:AAC(3) family N-acetyltransferase [Desulfonatronum thioautotrophicum]